MKTVRLTNPALRNIGLHMALLFLGNPKMLQTRDYYEIWEHEQLKREVLKCAHAESVTEKCFGAMLLSLFARTDGGCDAFLDPDKDDPFPVNGWELTIQLSRYFLRQVRAGESARGAKTFKLVSRLTVRGHVTSAKRETPHCVLTISRRCVAPQNTL